MVNIVNSGSTINGNQSATVGGTTDSTNKDSSEGNKTPIDAPCRDRPSESLIPSSDEDSDDDSNSSDTSLGTDQDVDEDKQVKLDDTAFQRSYSAFRQERKWRLPSGSTVEDILHEAYHKNLKTKHGASIRNSIRNWILDVSDPKIQALFSTKDWEAIQAEIKPLPALDEHFIQSLERFNEVITFVLLVLCDND